MGAAPHRGATNHEDQSPIDMFRAQDHNHHVDNLREFEPGHWAGNHVEEALIEPDNSGGGKVSNVQEAGISHNRAMTRERRVALCAN